jgi:hypothetical protein
MAPGTNCCRSVVPSAALPDNGTVGARIFMALAIRAVVADSLGSLENCPVAHSVGPDCSRAACSVVGIEGLGTRCGRR